MYTQAAYDEGSTLLQPGSDNAQAIPLTISQDSRRIIAFGPAGTEPTWADPYQYQSGAALPEGSKQRIYGVDVNIQVVPNDLTAGSFFSLGMRLMHQEQYPNTGEASVEVGYSMFEAAVGGPSIGQFANAGFLKEFRQREFFSTAIAGLVNKASFNYRMFWRSKRGLVMGNNRAIFLWLETHPGSRECAVFKYCRVLMKADT